jgi:protein required for attachment to host cells
MKRVWVVVASSTVARLFAAESAAGPLEELEEMVHPEGRLHERELVSDLPGRTFDSTGAGRHAKAAGVAPKEQETVNFAIQVAERLEAARTEGRFDALVLVAAPRFLGLLRGRLSPPTRERVILELDQNLVHLDGREIREHLPERLYSTL